MPQIYASPGSNRDNYKLRIAVPCTNTIVRVHVIQPLTKSIEWYVQHGPLNEAGSRCIATPGWTFPHAVPGTPQHPARLEAEATGMERPLTELAHRKD